MSDHPTPNPEAWGITRGYHAWNGEWRDVPQSSIDSILQVMGAEEAAPSTTTDTVWVLREGETARVDGPWRLVREDGATSEGEGDLPALPLGYHELFHAGAPDSTRLIVAPKRCSYPERQWGWAVQLYALRSNQSWGIGDLGDLREFGALAAEQGAGFAIVNPLHAAMPGTPQDTSPYYPSSREFRNLLFLRIGDIPGAADLIDELDATFAEAAALNNGELIDRDEAYRLKTSALERIWSHAEVSPAFEAFREAEGEPLMLFAGYSALAEVHGGNWHEWPIELQHPSTAEVRAFCDANRDRLRFHQWVQWLLSEQLTAAGQHVKVIQDLAIGVNPSGADAWIWQDAMAIGTRVGAPPDEFNTRGQDWGLPPFIPAQLRRLKFEPFIRTVRAGLRNAGGLRIDHVMGLFRLYWIPPGADAAAGAFVQYPFEELLAIVALESHRAGAFVVGEDLGAVEDYMREQLHEHSILSYRLLWFESQPPEAFPEQALAAISTHDLPTVAGLFSGDDLEQQRALGMAPNEEATEQMVTRVGTWLGIDAHTSDDDAIVAANERLATAPSVLVSATLEDALGLRKRPNYPGTTSEYPNWSVPLPVSLEELKSQPLFTKTAEAMKSRR